MLIRTDTWHYQVWGSFNCKKDGSFINAPPKTICGYVGALMAILALYVFTGCMHLGTIVFFGLLSPMLALTWVGVIVWFFAKHDIFPMNHLPSIRVASYVVPVWKVLMLGCFAGALYLLSLYLWSVAVPLPVAIDWVTRGVASLWEAALSPFEGGLLILLVGCLPLARYAGRLEHALRSSDGWQIFKAYLKAKKEGLCPLVTFIDPNAPPTEDAKREGLPPV